MIRIGVVFLGVAACASVQCGAASPPIYPIKLLAEDGSRGDEFGSEVGISGGRAIVGARFDDDAGSSSGSAYLFDSATGAQIHKLVATDATAEDWFGISAAISGSTAVVGAYLSDARGTDSGAAYVFDATTGVQVRKLTASDGSPGDNFGITAALDGSTALIGAYEDDNRGSAYLFNAATGQQLRKLTAPGVSTEAYFGAAVDIADGMAIVGANADDALGNASGSAHLFNVASGARLFKLLPNDGGAVQQFGIAVAVSGNRALVSSLIGNGAVYVFDTTTGAQLHKLTASDGAAGGRFGISLALHGSLAVIGAYFDAAPQQFSGSAYLFDISTGQQLAKLTAPDGAAFDQFGIDVAFDGTKAIVGAWLDDDRGINSGSAYVYLVPEPGALACWLPLASLLFGSSKPRRRRLSSHCNQAC